MLSKKIFFILWSIYFLTHAASSSHDFEEVLPRRAGYVGKILENSRKCYNGAVTVVTSLQNTVRKKLGHSKARPHEEWFGKMGLKYSCGDFAAFMISDFTAESNQKQLNAQRVGLTYSLTIQEITGFQNDILSFAQRGNVLSVFGFLLQDIISDAVDCTYKGTAIRKTFQGYLQGITTKINGVNDTVKKDALQEIVEHLKTLDDDGKRRLGGIIGKLVDDNIQYYLRQGFVSVSVFGFLQGGLKTLGFLLGGYIGNSYFDSHSLQFIESCPLPKNRMITAMCALTGYCSGKVIGGVLTKVGRKFERKFQNYFYYNFIRQNARIIIDRNLVKMHTE